MRNGTDATFKANGDTCSGYLSPAKGGKGPGVIVIQEWWGLVDHVRDLCDRFAAEGFTALAPDLYHGKATKSPDDAGKLMMALNIDRAEKDLRGSVEHLASHPAVSSKTLGVVGFCMGGQLALFAAGRDPKIGPCVDFYGIHPKVQIDYAAIRGPVLGLFAEKDGSVPPAAARNLEAKLKAAGKQVEIRIYPGAQHAFFNDTRPEVYDAAAAKDAWTRVLALFRANVK